VIAIGDDAAELAGAVAAAAAPENAVIAIANATANRVRSRKMFAPL
jgi:hypothetical protein